MIRILLLLIFLGISALPALAQQERKKNIDPAEKMVLRANTRDQMMMSVGNMHQKIIRQRKQDILRKNQMQMQRRIQMQQHRRVIRQQQIRRKNAQRQAMQRQKRGGGR
jgi:hypothetical protein